MTFRAAKNGSALKISSAPTCVDTCLKMTSLTSSKSMSPLHDSTHPFLNFSVALRSTTPWLYHSFAPPLLCCATVCFSVARPVSASVHISLSISEVLATRQVRMYCIRMSHSLQHGRTLSLIE